MLGNNPKTDDFYSSNLCKMKILVENHKPMNWAEISNFHLKMAHEEEKNNANSNRSTGGWWEEILGVFLNFD